MGGMLAQEPAAPSGRFYGPIVSGSWPVQMPLQKSESFVMPPQPATFKSKNFVMPQPTTSPCSIPLLGAQIPKEVDFKIKQLAPPTEKLAPMPQAKVPAPTCESWSPR
jgi:hypothetical protein